MASIQKRDNSRWRARYRVTADRGRARHLTRKVDAQRWLGTITDPLTGRYVDPRAGSFTFGQRWRQWAELQGWARRTRESDEQALACVTFTDVLMRDSGPEHVQAWVKSLLHPDAQGAPTTMKTRFNYVRMCFAAGVKRRVIAADPTTDVKAPRPEWADVAIAIPSPEDVAAALDAAPVHFRAFVAACAFAGLRLGEGLQLGDVKMRRLEVRRQVQGDTRATVEVVSPKAGSARDMPVSDALVEILSRRSVEVGVRGPEQWLLTNGPGLWTRGAAGNAWRGKRRNVGMDERFMRHSLRHFYASGLIASGRDTVHRPAGARPLLGGDHPGRVQLPVGHRRGADPVGGCSPHGQRAADFCDNKDGPQMRAVGPTPWGAGGVCHNRSTESTATGNGSTQ